MVLPDNKVIDPGHWYSVYNPNVLKGDRPIMGDHTYFVWTTVSDTRALGGPPAAIANGKLAVQGTPEAQALFQNFVFQAELFHGETVFRPKDWSLVVSAQSKNAAGVADVAKPVTQGPGLNLQSENSIQDFTAGQNFLEVLLETHGAETLDSTSIRAGVQGFNADVEGLLVNDAIPGAHLFGQYVSNRYDINFFYGRTLQKGDFAGNGTQAFIPLVQQADIATGSLFVGDTFVPGFNLLAIAAYDDDRRTKGVRDQVAYATLASTGHLGRWNTQSALYLAAGNQDINVAGKTTTKNVLAPLVVLDLARPTNAWNWRILGVYAPGSNGRDDNSFDAPDDKENFAGTDFTGLLGGLNNVFTPSTGAASVFRVGSVLPTGRNGNQAPLFAGPGLKLGDLGTDLTMTPTSVLSLDNDAFFFDNPHALTNNGPLTNAVTGQKVNSVGAFIGDEVIAKLTWRPALNDNMFVIPSVALLFPQNGLTDLGVSSKTQVLGNLRVILAY